MSGAWKGGSTSRWRVFRAAILARDGYRCQIKAEGCLVRAPLQGGHVDHIVELHKGGQKYDPLNVRAACRACNLGRKKAREEPKFAPKTSW